MLKLNEYRKIHCIGIGGIGLSAIAKILLSRGYELSGSDMQESDMVLSLRELGAKVYVGHDAENVKDVDLIIYSAAISMANPELAYAKEHGIKAVSRAEALGALMSEYKNSIAISGTHGKTTTTSMVSLILDHADLEPTILVGGNLAEIGGNVKVGDSPYFVTEACEYMDSFLSLRPSIELILNIDSDHLDYFKDIDHIVSSFDKFTKLVPQGGKVIAFDANPYVKKIIANIPDAISFGYGENCTYYAKDIAFDENGNTSFTVMNYGKNLGRVELSVPGEHNMLNALAAFACCHSLGVDPEIIIDQLHKYHGTERRFDVVGINKNGVKIVDDYAHHPTEINATLSATENIKHGKLWLVFQPHTYTRTMALFDEFTDAFDQADVLILAEIYAAREKNIYKLSSKSLAEAIKEKHPEKEVYFMDNFEDIATYISDNAKDGDLVITMGAGDVYKIGDMILEK
ncbi:MAG: UDP-N-acetylmuramate--L-alanine ligase [Clostridia bacterium]|nr:UDP-N-acetylmuramate--L-alanine ligase [Clostridia bacterium]